jgi:hypothetical protein
MPVTYERVVEALRCPEWHVAVLALAREARADVDDPALLKPIAKDVRAALAANRGAPALRSAFAGVALARRKLHVVADALRPFTYEEGALRKIRWVLDELKQLVAGNPELHAHLGAIDSWVAFSALVALAREAEADLAKTVSRSPIRTLHAVIGMLDEDFHSGRRPPFATLAPTAFEELDAEQAAAGAAQVVELLARMGRLGGAGSAERLVPQDVARRLILAGYWLRELRGQEILVYRIGFKCISDAHSTFRIEAPTDGLGYALSYGYLQANHTPALRVRPRLRERVELRTLAEAFSEATRDASPYVLRTESERPHFGYRFREGHAAAVASVVNRGAAYREEELELRIAAAQLKVSPPELLDLEIARGVTTRDVVRLQRLLKFLALSRSAELDRSHLSADDRREARLLYVETDTFLRVAASFGLDRALAETLVSTSSWDALEPSRLDLQHTPILALRGHVLVPLAVASDSNLIRNGLWSSGRRPYPDGKIDPLVADLRLAFEIAGLPAWPNVRYEWSGKTYEIDLIAAVGSHLFVFEAKNTLVPCSWFELRTTWDALEKAAEQLDRHATALADATVRSRLSKRLGMDVAAAPVATCMVVAHPLLSGSRVLGHPVRQCDVVCNFVASGEGTAWIGEAGVTTRLRPEGKLNEAELLGLLDDDTGVYRDAWAAGLKRVRPARIGKALIQVVEYAFNPVVQLARSGLCTGERQAALEAAIARVSSLADDAPRDEVDAAWRDAAAAHEAAFASLEVAARAADVHGALESTDVAAVEDPGLPSVP